jgi:hypothetical protein
VIRLLFPASETQASLSALGQHWWHKLLACSELHRQQTILLNSKTGSIPHRFVDLGRPPKNQAVNAGHKQ